MKLKKWKEGLKLCINNAIQLRDDSELLIENTSYGHAFRIKEC